MRYLVSILTLTYALAVNGQSLDNFTSLKSEGEVPQDFYTTSTEKFEEDYKNNKDKDLDKNFFLSTRFYIDEVLLSGKVLFNDQLTKYVNKVAKYVLRQEKELLKGLRFYVIKSTAVNAFSTDQGVILFTTGLLAQLENEAQLAFIIAHEVSHYTEKHVRDGYIEQQNYRRSKGRYRQLSYDDAVNTLSVYNQQNELDADRKGIELYLKTEYSIDEIYGAFQVLLYSYLPFDERVFDSTWFDTELMKVPGIYFPDSINPITLKEDYDDEGSTHPNIKKRIDKALDIMEDKSSRGDKQFQISEDDFNLVRNLARFECVNLNLMNRYYGDALYDIYLLQQDFPNNRFLDLSFVKALYGLVKYKNHGRYNEVTHKIKKIEGESYVLHAFLKEINKEQLNVIAFRNCYDLANEYSGDPTFDDYLQDLKLELAVHSNIDPEEFKDMSYEEFVIQSDSMRITFDIQDSIKKIDESDLSKYQKIRIKKKLRALENEDYNLPFDENFHLFALHDIVVNENFIDELKDIKRDYEEEEERKDSIRIAQRKEISREGYHLGIDKLVVVDPLYENYRLNNKRNHLKSEDKKIEISNIYADTYKKLNMETVLLDSKDVTAKDVDKYNNMGLIREWMVEVLEHDDIDMIASTHDRMNAVKEEYGTSKFLFSGIYAYKERSEPSMLHLYGVIFFYTAPFALADLLIIHNYFEFVAFEIDADKDEIEFVQVNEVNLKSINSILRVYIYDVLYQLGSTK